LVYTEAGGTDIHGGQQKEEIAMTTVGGTKGPKPAAGEGREIPGVSEQ